MATRCRSCHARIAWARSTVLGRPYPADVDQDGNPLERDGKPVPHFETCPDAASWSRRDIRPDRVFLQEQAGQLSFTTGGVQDADC